MARGSRSTHVPNSRPTASAQRGIQTAGLPRRPKLQLTDYVRSPDQPGTCRGEGRALGYLRFRYRPIARVSESMRDSRNKIGLKQNCGQFVPGVLSIAALSLCLELEI
ncbi:hypothetical protein AOL_s00004g190 [Orbilia oligospora ATCC 24927]|uniref:Uncharacterized protein n=1 Tax=Arthrobotrys oligospora (strain ATCC 24927 / CBS 115.81 / DSM 1491) TaxID=756982 RepID=G1WY30_ARTOA|nr:hypothetical protein AOL_s00004g190 [Orbilia oligospora ATCC 24927]EGX54157.1 hypothetical protein AOL_s00004g190 [Orbilia oligospora ATCC 24927]